MANPFDRTPLHPLERWVADDFNNQGSQQDYALRFALQNLFAGNAGSISGFMGNGYRVVPNSPAGMSVLVSAGLGFIIDAADVPSNIGSVVGLNDQPSAKPLVLVAPQQFTVPANASGNPRIDIIEVKVDRRLENPSSRLVFDAGVGGFVPDTLDKTLAFTHDGRLGTVSSPASSTAGLSYKVGVPAGVPAAPSVTAGYVKIAEINVAAGAASITALHLVDRRPLLGPGGILRASTRFRLQYNAGAPIVSLVSQAVPAGMQLAIAPIAATRSSFELIVVGGQIASLVVNASIAGNASTGEALIPNMTAPTLLSVNTLYQTDLNALGIPLGIGQQIGSAIITGRWTDGTVVNVTNADLEDVTWNVTASVAY